MVQLVDDSASHAPQMVTISGSFDGAASSIAISRRIDRSFVRGYEGGLAPVVVHAEDPILRCIVGILVQEAR